MNKIVTGLVGITIIGGVAYAVLADPPEVCRYWGNITLNSNPAPVGTRILAGSDVNGNDTLDLSEITDSSTVDSAGVYFVDVKGDTLHNTAFGMARADSNWYALTEDQTNWVPKGYKNVNLRNGDLTGVEEEKHSDLEKRTLLCFPNPCSDRANIRYGLTGPAEWELFNSVGGRVAGGKITGTGSLVIDSSVLASGLYFFRVSGGGVEDTTIKLNVVR